MNKKINLLSTSVLFAILLIASCGKKKEDAKPAPSITADSASRSSSITDGYYESATTFRIYYKVTSSENLSSISISESATQSITTNQKPLVQTPADVKIFNTPTSHKDYYETQIPINASSLVVTIKVTDSKGLNSSISFKARTSVTYPIILGASSNTTHGSYLGSSTFNNSYKESEFGGNADKIDITFDQLGNPTIQPMLLSTQQRTIDKIMKGAGQVVTYFQAAPVSLDFDKATPNQLANLTPSASQKVVVAQTQVYEFVSPTTGAKGLIRVKAYNDGGLSTGAGSITCDIKVVNTK